MKSAYRIHIQGLVQGVGFRPFVYRCARRNLISGWVLNAEDGVHIHAEGEDELLASFLQDLEFDAPAAAKIASIAKTEVPLEGFEGFEIRESQRTSQATTLVSPDIATCPACLAELFDPEDRRYHYPFINCTDCGPRFTIIRELPYDRAKTSMDSFAMCPDCAQEYADPSNRRFHAQPDACFDCGPSLSLWAAGEELVCEDSDHALSQVAQALAQGKIVAIKGLGGYQLACDATNEQAVELLRARKHRLRKPLAIMVHDAGEARNFCRVTLEEEALLGGSVRPIVLLERRPDAAPLAESVAFGLHELGIMLPYTPVHHLLLAQVDFPLVMTSGNISEDPILSQEDEAHHALGQVADLFLDNNRPIVSRYDDSVVRVVRGRTFFVRRARGYAPAPLAFPDPQAPSILAAGPEQKATFCITRGDEAFVSQHIGDLENLDTLQAWHGTRELYQKLFELEPTVLACDQHPEYLASKWAREQAGQTGQPLVEVQHHHAHIASVLGENGLPEDQKVIGLAFDGTGYGTDGSIWGGEVLLASRRDFQRLQHLSLMPMPGGAAAILHPSRMAFGLLQSNGLLDHSAAHALIQRLGDEARLLEQMLVQDVNCPKTSSLGRLFDGIGSLLGLGDDASYDGSVACALEAALYGPLTQEPAVGELPVYRFALVGEEIQVEPVVRGVLDSMEDGVPTALISRAFHDAVAEMMVQVCRQQREVLGEDVAGTVALSGGCFMNRYLLTKVWQDLEETGFTVLLNKQLPPNDGCIAYGQSVVAAATCK